MDVIGSVSRTEIFDVVPNLICNSQRVAVTGEGLVNFICCAGKCCAKAECDFECRRSLASENLQYLGAGERPRMMDPVQLDSLPQAKLPKAMARKAIVMAADTPVIDQPVSPAMDRRKPGTQNMAPNATQASRPPAATMTQR